MGFVASYARNLCSVALGRQPSRPLLFSYYVTHRCNLNCRYCCDGDGKRFREDPVPELSTDKARRLVGMLARAADTLDVTGGEPMLRPDLEAILEHARGCGMRTVLNTKGIGLRERPGIVALTDVLVFSIDSLDPARLAEVMDRPVEIAERVLDALHFAMERRGEKSTRLVLSVVATPTNIDDIRGVLRFALENRIGFHVSPEIVGVKPNQDLRSSPSYRRVMDEVLQLKRQAKGVLGVPAYLRGIRGFEQFRCYPLLMPTIRPDGKLYYPCLESKQAEVSILEAGGYRAALFAASSRFGGIPDCRDCCHVFCHMAISLYQRHPLSALAELKHWAACSPARNGPKGGHDA